MGPRLRSRNSSTAKQRVHQRQGHPPEFTAGDSAQEQRNPDERQQRQQPVKGRERPRDEFPQHYVVAFKSVRKSRPKVPSRFSSLRQSAARKTPASRHRPK